MTEAIVPPPDATEVMCEATVELGPDDRPMLLLQFEDFSIGLMKPEQAEGLAELIHHMAGHLRNALTTLN